MKDLVAKIKSADYKKLAVDHGEKIFAGLSDHETSQVRHFLLSAPEPEWNAICRMLGNSEAIQTRKAFKAMRRGA